MDHLRVVQKNIRKIRVAVQLGLRNAVIDCLQV